MMKLMIHSCIIESLSALFKIAIFFIKDHLLPEYSNFTSNSSLGFLRQEAELIQIQIAVQLPALHSF